MPIEERHYTTINFENDEKYRVYLSGALLDVRGREYFKKIKEMARSAEYNSAFQKQKSRLCERIGFLSF